MIQPSKNFYFLVLSFFCGFCSLLALDLQMTDLQSDYARFDAEEFVLEGAVFLENEWITAKASEARLSKAIQSAKFDRLELNEQVHFCFNQNEKIVCNRALLDAKDFKMSFFANPVSYFSQLHQLKVEGAELDVFFEKESTKIKELVAKDSVHIELGPFLTALASNARYQEGFEGISLSLFSREESARIFDSRGLSFYAHSFNLQGKDRSEIEQVIAYDGRGCILGHLFPINSKHELDFSAQEITWRDGRDLIELKKNVYLEQKDLMRIVAREILELGFEYYQGKYCVSAMQSFGDSDFFYLVPEHPVHIFCPGKALLEKSYANFEREKERQVYFEDDFCKIWSDRASIEREEGDDLTVCMRGEVKIATKDTQRELYALADRLDFSLLNDRLVLKAQEDRKVLFFDKSKNMQLSAEEISIRWNPENPFEDVEANGKVRCFFQAQEMEEIHKIFSS